MRFWLRLTAVLVLIGWTVISLLTGLDRPQPAPFRLDCGQVYRDPVTGRPSVVGRADFDDRYAPCRRSGRPDVVFPAD